MLAVKSILNSVNFMLAKTIGDLASTETLSNMLLDLNGTLSGQR